MNHVSRAGYKPVAESSAPANFTSPTLADVRANANTLAQTMRSKFPQGGQGEWIHSPTRQTYTVDLAPQTGRFFMANVSNPKGHNFGFHGTGLILNGDPLKTHAGQGSIGAAHQWLKVAEYAIPAALKSNARAPQVNSPNGPQTRTTAPSVNPTHGLASHQNSSPSELSKLAAGVFEYRELATRKSIEIPPGASGHRLHVFTNNGVMHLKRHDELGTHRGIQIDKGRAYFDEKPIVQRDGTLGVSQAIANRSAVRLEEARDWFNPQAQPRQPVLPRAVVSRANPISGVAATAQPNDLSFQALKSKIRTHQPNWQPGIDYTWYFANEKKQYQVSVGAKGSLTVQAMHDVDGGLSISSSRKVTLGGVPVNENSGEFVLSKAHARLTRGLQVLSQIKAQASHLPPRAAPITQVAPAPLGKQIVPSGSHNYVNRPAYPRPLPQGAEIPPLRTARPGNGDR